MIRHVVLFALLKQNQFIKRLFYLYVFVCSCCNVGCVSVEILVVYLCRIMCYKKKKVSLGCMPLIDTPIKRVAVDIVAPLAPPSEAGHRYILSLVDYATRYQEAVPLKKMTTEAVVDSLLYI